MSTLPLWSRLRSWTGASRAPEWLLPKVVPLVGVSLLTMQWGQAELTDPWRSMVGAFLLPALAVGFYGYFLNDVCDLVEDRALGKANFAAHFSPPVRRGLLGLALFAAFTPCLLLGASPLVCGLLLLEVLVVTAYSTPPLRLKVRGLAGVLADATGAHLLPTALVVAHFASLGLQPLGARGGLFMLTLLGACFLLGVRGILGHQLRDAEADRQAHIATFVNSRPLAQTTALLLRLHRLELWLVVAGALLAVEAFPLLALALAFMLAADGVKAGLGWTHTWGAGDYRVQLPYRPLWNNYYYEAWLPAAAIVSYFIRGDLPPAMAGLLMLLGVVQLVSPGRDLGQLVRSVAQWARRYTPSWELSCEGGSRAQRSWGSPLVVRVDVANGVPWSVQLGRRLGRIPPARRLRLEFRAKASQGHAMVVGLIEDAPPWRNLGLYQSVPVGTQWQAFFVECLPAASSVKGRLMFFLGSQSGELCLEKVRWHWDSP